MPMSAYLVLCYRPGCGEPAVYKIAARWSDGVTEELKTYALSCPACLESWFKHSCEKQRACRLTTGETLETPGIYRLERFARDRELERLVDLEKQLSS